MNSIDKISLVLDAFTEGKIPADELLLHVEPILVESATDRSGEDEVKRIVNAIERTIFTQVEPARTSEITELLKNARSFVKTRQSA